jgi:hypothetical protein
VPSAASRSRTRSSVSPSPLENHIRCPLPLRSGEGPDVARLDDGAAPFAELSEQGALENEAFVEGRTRLFAQVGGTEDLERDATLPHRMGRAVHGRRSAGVDDGLDDILVRDRRADERERIERRHRNLLPPRLFLRLEHGGGYGSFGNASLSRNQRSRPS